MSNAANKLAAVLMAAAIVTACTSESEKRQAAAEALRTQAEQLVAAGSPEQAMILLDSIDSAYREQTAVRRNAMATRAAAVEARALAGIAPADTRIAQAQLRVDSLAGMFTAIEGPRGLEGYTVAREIAKQDVTVSGGIQPRLDADGYLSIAAVLKGKKTGLNSISLTTASGTVAVQPIGPDRRIDSEGAELAVFRQEEITDLLEALDRAEGTPAKIHIDGSKGSVEVKLTPALRKALTDSWHYAMARQELRSALIERERIERTLQTARDHRANAPLPPTAGEQR